MPLSAAQRRKLADNKVKSGVGLSRLEKETRAAAKKEKNTQEKEEQETQVPAWAITVLAIAVFGSVIAQLYFNIANSPNVFGGGGEGGDQPQPDQ